MKDLSLYHIHSVSILYFINDVYGIMNFVDRIKLYIFWTTIQIRDRQMNVSCTVLRENNWDKCYLYLLKLAYLVRNITISSFSKQYTWSVGDIFGFISRANSVGLNLMAG